MNNKSTIPVTGIAGFPGITKKSGVAIFNFSQNSKELI